MKETACAAVKSEPQPRLAVALVGLALIPVAIRNEPADRDTFAKVMPVKTGWAILIGFLVVMAVVVAYFTLMNE